MSCLWWSGAGQGRGIWEFGSYAPGRRKRPQEQPPEEMMRKAQKKQAEEFTALLEQAHREIKRFIENGNAATAMDLLAQCQEGALQLGELIKKTEGESCTAISLLEGYCETLYCVYNELNIGGVNAARIHKLLRQQLFKVENSIKNDICVRKEVVFLPYKASMWDSLESVWRAAEEDPDCDAYVIPIPYYDRNPDGSFGRLHYEGSQYPEYVPVTWYENYDFENRRPDMIFIHNSYDENNYVTSVPPFFYSVNLKQFTEQLIYIPYFVLDEVDPENEAALEGIKHFCLVPGVLNADKVIVQSEDMRQAYINVLLKNIKDTPGQRKYWEGRILGIGSPKMDKVLETRKEDLELPEEWLKVIRKPDGEWKKIILYNTSVTALLHYNEKMLEKMKDVLGAFKENQKEIALLWRPHPLIQATIESMRPQLWREYRKLVECYREEGWGIYDDSPELNRAIALSDGYYGDPSSLVQLYKGTGKPIMLQNPELLDEKTP